METIIKWISALAPFLATYPPFVKVLFAAWVILGAGLLVSLTLASSSRTAGTSAEKQTKERAEDERLADARKDIWIVIDGLDFFAAREGAQVQVVANVNGTELIYPSLADVKWLEVGPSMSSQTFRLPPADRYVIRFKASVRVPSEHGGPAATGQLTSVKEDIVTVATDIPFTGRYVLHTFDPIHMARGADAQAEVRYRVTYDPK